MEEKKKNQHNIKKKQHTSHTSQNFGEEHLYCMYKFSFSFLCVCDFFLFSEFFFFVGFIFLIFLFKCSEYSP